MSEQSSPDFIGSGLGLVLRGTLDPVRRDDGHGPIFEEQVNLNLCLLSRGLFLYGDFAQKGVRQMVLVEF